MAALIWLGYSYGRQEPVKAHRSQTLYNLDEDIEDTGNHVIIAKGNIIEGIEAKE